MYRKFHPEDDRLPPKELVDRLYTYVMSHSNGCELYRIFYYDCEPLDKRVHHPLTNRCINFGKTDIYRRRIEILNALKRKRKVALRRGILKEHGEWLIRPSKTKDLLQKKIKPEDLSENDISLDLKQKGVDIKIGLDIASIAFKKLATQIVLISGDSDFVPAAKLARREGLDFILDPMLSPISSNLFEHIDGLKTFIKKR